MKHGSNKAIRSNPVGFGHKLSPSPYNLINCQT